MDEMTILSVNEHHDLKDHAPMAIMTSAEGFTLLLWTGNDWATDVRARKSQSIGTIQIGNTYGPKLEKETKLHRTLIS